MDILVFKTSVTQKNEINELMSSLNALPNVNRWNFDLEDCDNILRIEASNNITGKVVSLLNHKGFFCEELPD